MLHSYTKLVAAATFLLIVAGGLVTSTDSGLSVPDWPLSYGQFFPPMVGGIRFEHTHRVIAALVGILTLILAIALFRKEKRTWVRTLGVSAFFLVVAQALLGGLTVLYLLPTAVSVLHACVAQTFFALLPSLVLFTSREWQAAPTLELEEARSFKRLFSVTALFIYLQLVAGAIVRHTAGQGIAFHFILAFLIALHVLLIVIKTASDERVREKFMRHALLLGTLVVVQIFLGFGAFTMTLMLPKAQMPRVQEVLLTTAHQSTGALILATSFLLMLRSFRLFKSKAPECAATTAMEPS